MSAYNASLKNIMYADAGVGWHFSPKIYLQMQINRQMGILHVLVRVSSVWELLRRKCKIEDADFGTLGDTVEVTPGSD